MKTIAVLKGFHKRGIICVDFSGMLQSQSFANLKIIDLIIKKFAIGSIKLSDQAFFKVARKRQ